MSGSRLLDTNIVAAIFNEERAVLSRLAQVASILVPSIVLGELFYGAYKSTHHQENLLKLREFASSIPVLLPDLATSDSYGQIKFQLRRQGTPIPENDLWIAALARRHDCILVSRDQHFQRIENLRLEAW